jgi:TrmH family RNA methyltransferase
VSDYLRLNCPVYYVDDNVFDKAVETVTPSGAVALIRIRRLEPAKPQNNALILDRISDPGNLGAIIRTAASAGYPDIYMINCADAYSGKVVRASMGGIFRVKLYDIELSEVNELFKGISVIALDADGDSIYNIKSIQDRYALIIGNEASGISDCLMEQADRIISLPMSNGMESLNAAVAAGAAMYYLGGLNYVRP